MWLKVTHLPSFERLFNKGKQLRASIMLATIQKSFSTEVEERLTNVNGININYLKTGSGEHPVLLMPSTLGTIWTDFKPQIENLDKTKMTIVAWDPPGYGKSRPPERTWPENFLENDANLAHDLMKSLGFDKFSVIGWSGGGCTAYVLAANYPQSVKKLITSGASAYLLPSEMKTWESIRNIDAWSDRMKAPLISTYGEDYLRKTWSAWVDAMSEIFKNKNGHVCTKWLPEIQCPTLITHGGKDTLINIQHGAYLQSKIKNTRYKLFEDGNHNLHLRFHEEFNKLATDFITEK